MLSYPFKPDSANFFMKLLLLGECHVREMYGIFSMFALDTGNDGQQHLSVSLTDFHKD